MKISATAVVTVAALAGGLYLWKKRAGLIEKLTPKSAAEKQVDVLYGPGQGWRTRPVYNTPGQPGYIPTLPASYAPGTGPGSARSITINPFDVPSAPASTAITINPFDITQSGANVDTSFAQDASMFGLGAMPRRLIAAPVASRSIPMRRAAPARSARFIAPARAVVSQTASERLQTLFNPMHGLGEMGRFRFTSAAIGRAGRKAHPPGRGMLYFPDWWSRVYGNRAKSRLPF